MLYRTPCEYRSYERLHSAGDMESDPEHLVLEKTDEQIAVGLTF